MSDRGVAVVGAGFIGPVHVEGLRRAGQRVVGILGVTAEESAEAARRLGLKAYRDYDQVLGDPEVRAIHIATPNRLHFDMARRALQSGKHVLCEKPLAMDAQESAQLVRLAAEVQLAAGVNYNIRYYPLCLEAADRVRQGLVGKILHVTGSYVQDWLFHPTDFNWRVLADEGGPLRAVADIGTHWLDLLRAITGQQIDSVCADLLTVHPVRQRPRGEVETFSGRSAPPAAAEAIQVTTEDYGCIMFRLAGGGRGCLHVSQVTAGRKNCLRFEIAGSREALAWDSQSPNELWIGHRDEPNQSLLRDPALVGAATRRYIDYPGGHNEGFPDTFKQCFRAFYSYIDAGDLTAPAIFPTFADGHHEIVLCEAILRSHRERSWVEVPPAQLPDRGDT